MPREPFPADSAAVPTPPGIRLPIPPAGVTDVPVPVDSLFRSRSTRPHIPQRDLRPYFCTLDDLPPGPWSGAELFGNDQPWEIEVGSGRGLFLLNAGLAHPERNFLGIECDFKEARRAARRLAKRHLANTRLLGADARLVLARYVQPGSVAAVHVYFPDPWWKRRHQKRRIFNEPFLQAVQTLLQPGGSLHAWTDVAEYFELMHDTARGFPELVLQPPPAERPAAHDMDYHTSFERKKRKAGLPIFRACWRRA